MGIGVGTFEKSTEVKLPKGFQDNKNVDIAKLQEVQQFKHNKDKYDKVIEDNRQFRIKKEKQRIIDTKYNQMYDKLKEKGLIDQSE